MIPNSNSEKKIKKSNLPSIIYDVDLDEFYEEKINKSKTKSTKRYSTGRYELPEYVRNVHEDIKNSYPDICPPVFLIDKILKSFWREIENQLKEEKDIKIFGFGTFKANKKISYKTQAEQYYIKFKISRHFISRIREHFGTMTQAEQITREKQKAFMQQVWEARMKTKALTVQKELMENKQPLEE